MDFLLGLARELAQRSRVITSSRSLTGLSIYPILHLINFCAAALGSPSGVHSYIITYPTKRLSLWDTNVLTPSLYHFS